MEANSEILELRDSILRNPAVVRIGDIFRQNSYELRLVGGAVRDILIGREPKDLDFATPALPGEVIAILQNAKIRVVETGLQHGTVTAVLSPESQFEITTLRIDTDQDGRHAKVVYTESWKKDAERRDLTINAMSMDLEGTLYDYYGGEEHLQKREIRFVGDPNERIREDYLRILRYFRFYGKLHRVPDSSSAFDELTLTAIRDNATGLERISGERIWMETAKILTCDVGWYLLNLMEQYKIMEYIGLAKVDSNDLKIPHQTCRNPVGLLTWLLKDETSFLDICTTWHLSNAEKKLGLFIVRHREIDLDLMNCQDLLVEPQPLTHVIVLLELQGKTSIRDELRGWDIPKFPVTGQDLLKAGMKSGKELGITLSKAKSAWKESRFQKQKDELLKEFVQT